MLNHLKSLKKILGRINRLSEPMRALSDSELAGLTDSFKQRLANGETLDHLLVEAFAAMREAAWRKLKMYPYDEQVLAAIALFQGKIVEMKTGEGKTLAAILPLYLNALSGKSTILVTSNDYLARRDALQMSTAFNFMGISVGISAPEDPATQLSNEEKKEIYSKDIVYTTHGILAFDYLLENLITKKENKYLRPFDYIVIDEVDSVLLDACNMPLVISGAPRVQSNLYESCDQFVSTLKEDVDYETEDDEVYLSEKGIRHAEEFFNVTDFYSEQYFPLVRHIMLALRAHVLFKRNEDYVVSNNKVMLLDHRSGRIFENTKLKSGLHQAIEAKEHCELTRDSKAMASITYQSFFHLFHKISGMSGAVYHERQELKKVYDLDVIVIPTHRMTIRKDLPDRYFGNKEAQFEAATQDILKIHGRHQPLLIVTNSIDASYEYSRFLLDHQIPHNVLNAYNVAKEAEIIKDAGRYDAVTVATSVAGRGTDIKLGPGVRELGGLFVMGIGRHRNLRSETQARGRSGRQGDPGVSQFYVSIDDDVIDEYGSTKLVKYLNEGTITSTSVIRRINQAQKNAEFLEQSARSKTMEFDRSLTTQRTIIYKLRDEILAGKYLDEKTITHLCEDCIDDYLENSRQSVKRYILDHIAYVFDADLLKGEKSELRENMLMLCHHQLAIKKEQMGDSFSDFLRVSVLNAVDQEWIEQVDYLEQLRMSIQLRQYSQRNIIYMYHQEAYSAFGEMMKRMKEKAMRNLMLSMILAEDQDTYEILLP